MKTSKLFALSWHKMELRHPKIAANISNSFKVTKVSISHPTGWLKVTRQCLLLSLARALAKQGKLRLAQSNVQKNPYLFQFVRGVEHVGDMGCGFTFSLLFQTCKLHFRFRFEHFWFSSSNRRSIFFSYNWKISIWNCNDSGSDKLR